MIHPLLALLAIMFGVIPQSARGEPLPSSRTGRLQLQSAVVELVEPRSVTAVGSTWHTPNGLLECADSDLLAWGHCPAEVIGPSVQLGGGSIIAGELVSWSDREAVIASPLLGLLRLPTVAVSGWQATGARATRSTDAVPMSLHLVNGDTLVARDVRLLEGSPAWEVWMPGDAAHGENATAVMIPREKVHGFFHGKPVAQHRTEEAALLVGLEDGSRIIVTSLETIADRSVLPLAGADPAFTSSITCPNRAVVGLVAVGPHARPLAWLEPSIFEQSPRFGRPWPFAIGTTLTGDPLHVRGHRGFTGFGLHASARLAYQLPPLTDRRAGYRLQASVAVDDSAGQGGSVVVRIRGGELQTAAPVLFESGVLRGGQAPLAIDLDIGRSRWLELEVDPTQDGDVLDRTVWLEPRLLTHQTSRTSASEPSLGASDASPETYPGHR